LALVLVDGHGIADPDRELPAIERHETIVIGGELLDGFSRHPFKELSVEVVDDIVACGENGLFVEIAFGINACVQTVVDVLSKV
jgi:hypothetical protein